MYVFCVHLSMKYPICLLFQTDFTYNTLLCFWQACETHSHDPKFTFSDYKYCHLKTETHSGFKFYCGQTKRDYKPKLDVYDVDLASKYTQPGFITFWHYFSLDTFMILITFSDLQLFDRAFFWNDRNRLEFHK